MKIEIWSDIVCPWCYIGKRRLEKAIDDLKYQDKVTIEYKSFQLDPNMETDTSINIYQYLSEKKGLSIEDAMEIGQTVAGVAEDLGLQYNLDKTIPINTLKSHELIHFAKSKGLQTEAKEALLSAYLTEGKNLSDLNEIASIGEKIGLNKVDILESLQSNYFSKAVKADIKAGNDLGISGVPFFVFNRKFGISGAQAEDVFKETLLKSFQDWEIETKNKLSIIAGEYCEINGDC